MGDTRYDHTREKTGFARKLRRDVSKTEHRLWPRLRGKQMGASFRRQHPIATYFADYCCVPLKLVVEVDGPLHERSRDAVRDHAMRALGFEILRFTAAQLDDGFEEVVAAIFDSVQSKLLLVRAEGSARGGEVTPT